MGAVMNNILHVSFSNQWFITITETCKKAVRAVRSNGQSHLEVSIAYDWRKMLVNFPVILHLSVSSVYLIIINFTNFDLKKIYYQYV